ncbi:hypothetical protein Tco_0677732 [Tanacetum coccineum]|uniref:Tf2-1-like SH3-like domain-containing protein n=1 Tax=Tanacetum coccineum TaxID=301880 RepID=A0ABQ4XDZ3_9ASTR
MEISIADQIALDGAFVLAKVGTVAYRIELPQQLSRVHSTSHVSNLKKCLSDEPLAFPLDEIHIDDKLCFVEEPVEIMDREVKRLKRSRIPIIKVRWNSRRGPEFTWEREDQFRKKILAKAWAEAWLLLASALYSSDSRVRACLIGPCGCYKRILAKDWAEAWLRQRLLNIKVEFSVKDLETALILQNSTLFQNKKYKEMLDDVFKVAERHWRRRQLSGKVLRPLWKSLCLSRSWTSSQNYVVAVSLGHKVLGWRSIPTYNFVIVQDSLDEKCEVLLHLNGLSEDGTMTL